MAAITDEISQSCGHAANAQLDSTAVFDKLRHVPPDLFVDLVWFSCRYLHQGTVEVYKVIYQRNWDDHITVCPGQVFVHFQNHQICHVDHIALNNRTHREGDQPIRIWRCADAKQHVEPSAMPQQLIKPGLMQVIGRVRHPPLAMHCPIRRAVEPIFVKKAPFHLGFNEDVVGAHR